jgi:ribose/xylose/arabinose/galactoside ABC-type transport system permease subunit
MASERDGIVWPILLVVLGLLFLAHNLEFLQWKELRNLLSTWWPLVLIALGLAQLARRRKG